MEYKNIKKHILIDEVYEGIILEDNTLLIRYPFFPAPYFLTKQEFIGLEIPSPNLFRGLSKKEREKEKNFKDKFLLYYDYDFSK